MRNRKSIAVVGIVIAFCIIMAIVDGILQANYFAKSAIKMVLFLICPAVYAIFDKELRIKPLFIVDKKGMLTALCLGVVVYSVILGGYLILKDVLDFSKITQSLTRNTGVHGKNFIFVSLYISFVNSLLEEFFFRGFAFLTLKRLISGKVAYFFSATVFSLYHVAMMIGWFGIELFVAILVGLFAGGMIFNRLNEKSGTVYPSWIVHMFANFAINTIGFILFGII